jgi:hypothetical protein
VKSYAEHESLLSRKVNTSSVTGWTLVLFFGSTETSSSLKALLALRSPSVLPYDIAHFPTPAVLVISQSEVLLGCASFLVPAKEEPKKNTTHRIPRHKSRALPIIECTWIMSELR